MSKISLRNRVLFIVGFASFLCAVIAVAGFLHFNRQELERGIVNKQRTIHSQLAAATEFVARQGGLPGVVAKLRAKYTTAEQLTSDEKREVLNQVPIFSAIVIGEKNSKTDRYMFRVSSDQPRRKEHQATPEELAIQQKFEANPALEELVVNDGARITTYRPVRLQKEQGCLTCHGDPATSPWGNGRDILGFKMENWTDGKLHGVFAVSQDIAAVAKASTEGQLVSPSEWLILSIIAGALLSVLASAYLVRGPLSSLNHVAVVLASTSQEVTTAADHIATSAQSLSQASSVQATSLQQTASAIEQMSSMIVKNSDNAKDTSVSSNESRTKAEKGQQVVEQMIRSIDEINESNTQITRQIEQSNSEMSQIVNVIKEISEKTKVINDIVFQTKLLSFNASVEAARAGEHGKGFAVVAEEIGNLAQMSGNAANEIATMLEGSTNKVNAILTDMESKVETLVQLGKDKVENGTMVAQECGRVLNDIVANVTNVSRMAGEISVASQEQSQGIRELTSAMNQLDQVTQQNATSSDQSAKSAEQLSEQASSLKTAVSELMCTIRGRSA